ncbi:MAG TPA: NCS2 family permease [Alphaproteobacteria bacterium]|jgi:AGZA family xanthine/uracil permease-like MFS transporter|nr:NCS2 family permease [Alphaproteobacteria bacterium]
MTIEAIPTATPANLLDRFFKIGEHGSTISREVVAGLTTFAAMSYVIVVNPAIVSSTGMDREALIIVTILASVIGSIFMGLAANLPIGLAPAMGSNLVFTQTLVLQLGVSWHIGLTIIFLDSIAFLFLALSGFREKLVQGFPDAIKLGIQCGLGLFIAYIGLKNGGLVISTARSPIAFGNLSHPDTLLTFIGVLATPVLLVMRVPGALLVSIVVLTIIGFFVPGADPGSHVTPLPEHILALPKSPSAIVWAFDFKGLADNIVLLLPIILYFFLSDFFAATTTLIGVTRRAKLTTPNGSFPNAREALSSDAAASIVGAALGTPTVTGYIESVTGVEAGGRTGLTALVVAGLFALSLFLWPLIAIIPAQATAPALVVVGVLMMEGIREIDPAVPESCFPPILTLLVTVCTADLMAGMATGCLAYTLTVAGCRKWSKITPMMLIIDAVFILYFVVSTKLF